MASLSWKLILEEYSLHVISLTLTFSWRSRSRPVQSHECPQCNSEEVESIHPVEEEEKERGEEERGEEGGREGGREGGGGGRERERERWLRCRFLSKKCSKAEIVIVS